MRLYIYIYPQLLARSHISLAMYYIFSLLQQSVRIGGNPIMTMARHCTREILMPLPGILVQWLHKPSPLNPNLAHNDVVICKPQLVNS